MPSLPQPLQYYTYEDYKNWEGEWELIDGFAMAPSPTISHQAIASEIVFELIKSVRECKNCLVVTKQDWKINETTIIKPDIALICNEENKAYITKAPLIVVEIISKTTAIRDEKYKFKIYKDEKVKYYVLVYPQDLKAKIYKLENNQYIKQGDFLEEEFFFNDLECKASINFKEVFRKLRG